MFSNHLKFAWDIDELIECEEFWPRLTQILSHNKDISRPVAVLLLADSIYQEGVEGCRARGRANLPSLQWRLWSMVKLFTLFDMYGCFFLFLLFCPFMFYFIFAPHFPQKLKMCINFFPAKRNTSSLVGWNMGWQLTRSKLNERGIVFTSGFVFATTYFSIILCCVKNKWNVKR